MQKKVFLISDAHIKSRLWVNFAGVQGDSYAALEQIAREVTEDSVLITCGDTLDSNRPTSQDLDKLQNFYKKFTKIYTIKGNHDDCDPQYSSVLSPNCVALNSSKPEKVNDFELFGIDYTPSREVLLEQLSNVLVGINTYKCNNPVVIMHQSIAPFFTYKPLISFQDIVNILGDNVRVYVGDTHLYATVLLDDGFILSPGPLVPQDLGQVSKVQYYFTLDDVGDYCPHAVQVRDFHILESDGSTEALYAQLAQLKTVPSTKPLQPVVVVKAPVNYTLPKDLVNTYKQDFIIIMQTRAADSTGPENTEPIQNLSLDEAVEEAIEEETEGNVKLLKSIYNLCSCSPAPDEVLDNLLAKWKVIR